MPLIHHPVLKRELTVSETHAGILTTLPRSPWKRGPLHPKKSTAAKPSSPERDTTPSTEEED